MNSDSEIYRLCLAMLQAIIPYQYGQWLIEDTDNHDYRVIASIIPDNEEGYEIAHRTGVIGQVFRMEKSILVPDARNHPLYDPFDQTIDWELCFPVFADDRMKAVINLEGAGAIEMRGEDWERIYQVVEETTKCRPPSSAPQANSYCLIETRRIVIRANHAGQRSDIVEMGKAISRAGESTLLVGHYPELLGGRRPNMAEASQQGLGVSYCYFGVERKLDLLATGLMIPKINLKNVTDWWSNSKGRYAFVLLYDDTEFSTRDLL
ncbi:MAG: GAF domain-containing protein [Pyrinomonadaceae bacterium]